jgi:colicin import membrane protein
MNQGAVETTELAVVPAAMLPTILANDTDDILGKIARKVAAFRPDVSTKRGRDEMRSLAAEIRSSKASLIRIGKGLTEDWRKSVKAVNEECSVIEERMDALYDRVRQQLTDFENAEKARIAGHEDALARRLALTSFEMADPPSDLIRERLKEAEAEHVRDWQEFRERASDQRVGIIDNLTSMLAAAVRREADAAELAARRAADEERERQEIVRQQAEREARIAAEAAEAAKREAERVAAEQAAEAARKAAAEQERIRAEAAAAAKKAEEERVAGERREREAQERAEAAERARVAAEAKAKVDAAEAARRAGADRVEAERLAEIKAERERIAAVESERKRAADAKAAEEAERKKREANKAHKAKINREALAALILCGLTEQQGVAVVTALAKAEIPHCRIEY